MTKFLLTLGWPLCAGLAVTCTPDNDHHMLGVLVIYAICVGLSLYHDHLECIRHKKSRRYAPTDEY